MVLDCQSLQPLSNKRGAYTRHHGTLRHTAEARAHIPMNAVDPASWFATKRRSQRARAGLSSCLCKGCGAALGPRACSSGTQGKTQELLRHRANSLTLARAATERSGGAVDRRTPERPVPVDALLRSLRTTANALNKHTHTIPREPHAPRGPRRLTRRAPSQPSHMTFRTKRTLAKKMAQNRPIPQWIRMRTGNKIRWNSKRRHWRRTKLGL